MDWDDLEKEYPDGCHSQNCLRVLTVCVCGCEGGYKDVITIQLLLLFIHDSFFIQCRNTASTIDIAMPNSSMASVSHTATAQPSSLTSDL
jgi:DTW domain-containing protein YfiP